MDSVQNDAAQGGAGLRKEQVKTWRTDGALHGICRNL